MRLRVVLLTADFALFFLFIDRFSARSLRLCGLGDQKLLPDLQLPWIVNVIERHQIVVSDFQFLRDAGWVIALLHNVSLS